MSLIHRCCRIILLVVLFTVPIALVQAAPEIMPVDQLQVGMTGIAKTVVSGTTIEEFGVEVLGIMKNRGPAGDLILVRTFGDVIDRTGGIAQGMSGSPVYIDGKLVGAVSYGWSFSDHKIGMVTPIADMLKLWDMSDVKKEPVEAGKESSADQTATPEVTPLMASGFGDRALAMLKDKLQAFNLVPYAVGDAPAGTDLGPIQPGSAVGVQLVRGDVSLGALGTATYVEGNKVLAFGHPFLKKGVSQYFMTNAYVFTTVNGLESSFKVGTTGNTIGTINQDRGAGIAGEIDKFPGVVPLRVMVKDNTLGQSRDAAVQVIQDEQLAPILATVAAFNVIDKTMDRVGPGTAKVSFEVSARNMPGETFKRENMFYSAASIGEAAVAEFAEFMSLLSSNQFQAVDVMDVKVNVSIDAERRTATIMGARANVAAAKPGDTVNINVLLKPYRGESITRTVTFTVPKDQAPGPMTLEVRGGGTIPLLELLSKQQGISGDLLRFIDKQKSQTFEEMLKDFAARDRNNDIVVEVMDTDLSDLMGGAPSGKSPKTKLETGPSPNPEVNKRSQRGRVAGDGSKKPDDKPKSATSTDYIIDSDAQVIINVQKDDSSDGAAGGADKERKASYRDYIR